MKKKSGSVGSGGVQTHIFYHIGWEGTMSDVVWCEGAGVQFQLPAVQAKVTLTPKKQRNRKYFIKMKKSCETDNSERNHHNKLYFVFEFMHSVVNLLFGGNECTIIYLFII